VAEIVFRGAIVDLTSALFERSDKPGALRPISPTRIVKETIAAGRLDGFSDGEEKRDGKSLADEH
jgi:hypothetical protein